MMYELREDLPKKVDDRWNEKAIKIFDMCREKFKDRVEIAKKLYGNDKITRICSKDTMYESLMELLTSMMNQNKEIGQLFVKYPIGIEEEFIINRSVDAITAFYIPETIDWFKLKLDNISLYTSIGKNVERDIEEILEESKKLPNMINIEDILYLSRDSKKGFIHHQEKTIEFDGIKYNRYIIIQPFFSMYGAYFSDIRMMTSESCDIYLECFVFDNRNRQRLQEGVYFAEDPEHWMPIMHIKNGVVVYPYIKTPETNKNVDPEVLKVTIPESGEISEMKIAKELRLEG